MKAQKHRGAQPEGARALLIRDADESRVDTLRDLLTDVGQGRVSAGPPDPTGRDLVFNASPMGMEDDDLLPVDAALLSPSMFVGDVIAGHGVTPFLEAAQAAGCKQPTVTTWSRPLKTS